MPKPRNSYLFEKSIAAAISAIEIYNKPDFKYREECFSILMINSFELLLKAKKLKDNGNSLRSIYEMEYRTKKDGNKSKKKYLKSNRSGNPMTISFSALVDEFSRGPNILLDQRCVENIYLLIEIRDNSIHFFNKSLDLKRKVMEIGTAALKNYVSLASDWFGYDFSKHNFFLMPVSFFNDYSTLDILEFGKKDDQMGRFFEYVGQKENDFPSDENSKFNITLKIDVKFVKTHNKGTVKVRYSTDPSAPEVLVKEEDVLKNFPLDYFMLTKMLKERVPDFKIDKQFHKIKSQLEANKKLCIERLLSPGNPKSMKKKFYNPNIIKEIKKKYRVK